MTRPAKHQDRDPLEPDPATLPPSESGTHDLHEQLGPVQDGVRLDDRLIQRALLVDGIGDREA